MGDGLATADLVHGQEGNDVSRLQLCRILHVLDHHDITGAEVYVHILVILGGTHGVCLDDVELNAEDASVISIHGGHRNDGKKHHEHSKGNQ